MQRILCHRGNQAVATLIEVLVENGWHPDSRLTSDHYKGNPDFYKNNPTIIFDLFDHCRALILLVLFFLLSRL